MKIEQKSIRKIYDLYFIFMKSILFLLLFIDKANILIDLDYLCKNKKSFV
jgi:hypothetical protein